MKQGMISMAVLGALMAEHTEQSSTGTVASLTKGKPLSGVILKAFFEGGDAKKVQEKVAAAEGSRLQYLIRTFPETSVEQVKVAVKEYKDATEREHPSDKKVMKVTLTRTGEIQALYGAWRWLEFKPEGMAYHDAVGTARTLLKEKAIRWAGDKIPEKWERDIRKGVEQKAQVELAAKMEIARAERTNGAELTEAEENAIYAKAAEQQAKADMVALARGLYKKYQAEKCEQLIEALETTIAQEQQAEKDKVATAKTAKAA